METLNHTPKKDIAAIFIKETGRVITWLLFTITLCHCWNIPFIFAMSISIWKLNVHHVLSKYQTIPAVYKFPVWLLYIFRYARRNVESIILLTNHRLFTSITEKVHGQFWKVIYGRNRQIFVWDMVFTKDSNIDSKYFWYYSKQMTRDHRPWKHNPLFRIYWPTGSKPDRQDNIPSFINKVTKLVTKQLTEITIARRNKLYYLSVQINFLFATLFQWLTWTYNKRISVTFNIGIWLY